MATVTAEVQVLTAEVRVLMVGSRQVTLSVFRQLDRVPREECSPFGRVRDSRDLVDLEIVGHRDGVLVRSQTEEPREVFRGYVAKEVIEECVPREARWGAEGRKFATLCPGLSFEFVDYYAHSPLKIYDPDKFRRAMDELVEHFTVENDWWVRWSDLPLIILAGLR